MVKRDQKWWCMLTPQVQKLDGPRPARFNERPRSQSNGFQARGEIPTHHNPYMALLSLQCCSKHDALTSPGLSVRGGSGWVQWCWITIYIHTYTYIYIHTIFDHYTYGWHLLNLSYPAWVARSYTYYYMYIYMYYYYLLLLYIYHYIWLYI